LCCILPGDIFNDVSTLSTNVVLVNHDCMTNI
jgi:hypothetical protein